MQIEWILWYLIRAVQCLVHVKFQWKEALVLISMIETFFVNLRAALWERVRGERQPAEQQQGSVSMYYTGDKDNSLKGVSCSLKFYPFINLDIRGILKLILMLGFLIFSRFNVAIYFHWICYVSYYIVSTRQAFNANIAYLIDQNLISR